MQTRPSSKRRFEAIRAPKTLGFFTVSAAKLANSSFLLLEKVGCGRRIRSDGVLGLGDVFGDARDESFTPVDS